MAVETMSPGRRETAQIEERNLLQRELVAMCVAEGLFAKTDFQTMAKIFKLVSDIIDNPKEGHESIRRAYFSHDYDSAAKMLLTLVREELQR